MEFEYTTADFGCLFQQGERLVGVDPVSLLSKRRQLKYQDGSEMLIDHATRTTSATSADQVRQTWQEKIKMLRQLGTGYYQLHDVNLPSSETGDLFRVVTPFPKDGSRFSPYNDRIVISPMLYEKLREVLPESPDGDDRIFVELEITQDMVKAESVAFPPIVILGVHIDPNLEFRQTDIQDLGGAILKSHWAEWQEFSAKPNKPSSFWPRDIPSYRILNREPPQFKFVYGIKLPEWLHEMLDLSVGVSFFHDHKMRDQSTVHEIRQLLSTGYDNSNLTGDDASYRMRGTSFMRLRFVTGIPVVNNIRFYSQYNDELVHDTDFQDQERTQKFFGSIGPSGLDNQIFGLSMRFPIDHSGYGRKRIVIGYPEARIEEELIGVPVAKIDRFGTELYSYNLIPIHHKYTGGEDPGVAYQECEYEYYHVFERLLTSLSGDDMSPSMQSQIRDDYAYIMLKNQQCEEAARFFNIFQIYLVQLVTQFEQITGAPIIVEQPLPTKEKPPSTSPPAQLPLGVLTDDVDSIVQFCGISREAAEQLSEYLGLAILAIFSGIDTAAISKVLTDFKLAKVTSAFSRELKPETESSLKSILSTRKLEAILSLKYSDRADLLTRYSNHIVSRVWEVAATSRAAQVREDCIKLVRQTCQGAS